MSRQRNASSARGGARRKERAMTAVPSERAPAGRPLVDLLAAERLTSVPDSGATPIAGAPPYARMLRAGLCTVTGFEPQPEALAELNARKGPLEHYLPDVVGDGAEHL